MLLLQQQQQCLQQAAAAQHPRFALVAAGAGNPACRRGPPAASAAAEPHKLAAFEGDVVGAVLDGRLAPGSDSCGDELLLPSHLQHGLAWM